MPAELIIIQAPCNDCGRKTDHEVIIARTKHLPRAEEDYEWQETTYRMIECRGCHSISLQRSVTSWQDRQGDAPQTEYFPPLISRRKPNWFDEIAKNVPTKLALPDLLTEIYSALHANNRRLATMGTRALLDKAMTHKVTDLGDFPKKLDALVEKGFIKQKQREFLKAALDAGHAASHRGYCPTAKELNHVMDIVEDFLKQIYVLPNAVTKLKKSTPPRPPLKTNAAPIQPVTKKRIIMPTRRQSPAAQ